MKTGGQQSSGGTQRGKMTKAQIEKISLSKSISMLFQNEDLGSNKGN